jgi:hypothetical protein
MSIAFTKVVIHNKTGTDLKLTVEAPIGKVVSGPQTVKGNSTATINPGVKDCLSVLLSADDPTHGNFKQTFAMAPPKAKEGWHAYLESVEVDYIVSFKDGRVQARTE